MSRTAVEEYGAGAAPEPAEDAGEDVGVEVDPIRAVGEDVVSPVVELCGEVVAVAGEGGPFGLEFAASDIEANNGIVVWWTGWRGVGLRSRSAVWGHVVWPVRTNERVLRDGRLRRGW